MVNLRSQIMKVVTEIEERGQGKQQSSQPDFDNVLMIWVLFVAGTLTFDDKENNWFVDRIVRRIQALGVATWAEMEEILRHICWMDELRTPKCRSFWARVEVLNARP